MTLVWPLEVLPPKDIAFDIASRSLAGPSSVSGLTQVVASDAGIWKIGYGGIPVVNEQRVKAFRALSVLLEGMLNPILVPINCFDNPAYQPVPNGAIEAGLYDAVPHSDEAFFDDGSGYALDAVIDVVAAANAAARAVTMTVTVNYAGDIEPGQHFSIGERLYRVRSFDSTTGALTFRPPLREAVTAGTSLNFDYPVCRMRLATDDQMDLALEYNRWGFATVSFVEYL